MINDFDDACAVLWHKNDNLVIIHQQTMYKKALNVPIHNRLSVQVLYTCTVLRVPRTSSCYVINRFTWINTCMRYLDKIAYQKHTLTSYLLHALFKAYVSSRSGCGVMPHTWNKSWGVYPNIEVKSHTNLYTYRLPDVLCMIFLS